MVHVDATLDKEPLAVPGATVLAVRQLSIKVSEVASGHIRHRS